MKHTVSIITNELATQSGPYDVLVALLWEEEMAIHSIILAWKIPWTEKPGGLQFMGSQGVGHNWATDHTSQLYFTFASAHIFLLGVIELKKKESKQSVSVFYKPYTLIYSSFLKHTILEFWPEVFFCTYQICVDKQEIELNDDNDKLVSVRRKCWKPHVKLIWWSSCIRSIVECCHHYCKQRSWWYCVYACTHVLSRVRLFVIPWTVARQSALFMAFSRQESWSALPFPPAGHVPDPGVEPVSPTLAGGFFFFYQWGSWESPSWWY